MAVLVALAVSVVACTGGDDAAEGPTADADVAAYCAAVLDLEDLSLDVEEAAGPEELATATTRFLDAYREAEAVAPEEVGSDLALHVESLERYVARAGELEWDQVAIDQDEELLELINGEAFLEAGSRLSAFTAERCGAPPPGDDPDPAEPALVEYCAATAELDALDDETTEAALIGPEAFADAVRAQLEAARRAEAAAPEEIRTDLALVVDAFATLVAVGERTGWDVEAMALDPDFVALEEDPVLLAAGAALRAFNAERCGVVAD